MKINHLSLKKTKSLETHMIFVLVKGISIYPNRTGFWFWLEGIGERNLSLS
jgi:hypothetical protein